MDSASIVYGCYLFLLSFLLAKLEIQIEGAYGWAEKLPTWRITDPRITRFLLGKPLTGYHFYLNLVLLAFFHLPLLLASASVVLESEILYSYAICCVVWDFLWFVLNPSFGLKRYNPREVWWFKHWVLGLPFEYYVGGLFSFIFHIIPAILGKMSPINITLAWATKTLTIVILTALVTLFVTHTNKNRHRNLFFEKHPDSDKHKGRSENFS